MSDQPLWLCGPDSSCWRALGRVSEESCADACPCRRRIQHSIATTTAAAAATATATAKPQRRALCYSRTTRHHLGTLMALVPCRYGQFCLATEGVVCGEERWGAHCKALEADPAVGMEIEHFGRLYTDQQFTRHFGKLALDMPRVRTSCKRDSVILCSCLKKPHPCAQTVWS